MKKLTIIVLLISSFALGTKAQFTFPQLGYEYDALEKFIDKTTMEIHYTRHHKAYYNNFIKAVEELGLGEMKLEEIFARVNQYPATVRNNGGGFYNHALFWEVMSPNGGGTPGKDLLKAIQRDFGSFDAFKQEFEDAAKGRFGSGWAWLAVGTGGRLFVSSTANQDNPLMNVVTDRGIPILGLDVWEHAYYLHYQNNRGGYVGNFWEVVNWVEVERKYKAILN